MRLTRVLALGALAAALGAAGCSRNHPGNLTGVEFNRANLFAPDTTPNPPGPPPPPLPVQFLGSDSTREGQTGATRWRIGNPGTTATIHWILGTGSGWVGAPWPSFPIEGDLRVPTRKERDITVSLPVPAGTAPGIYPLTMLVMLPGSPAANAGGWIRVYSDSIQPPPPPPPPIPAVQFAGWDSLAPQPTISFWLLYNESDQPFDMQWTLTSARNWPGFPITGTRSFIFGNARDSLGVGIPIPDSAAAGFNRLIMTVTRPSGLPPQSADGDFPIVE